VPKSLFGQRVPTPSTGGVGHPRADRLICAARDSYDVAHPDVESGRSSLNQRSHLQIYPRGQQSSSTPTRSTDPERAGRGIPVEPLSVESVLRVGA